MITTFKGLRVLMNKLLTLKPKNGTVCNDTVEKKKSECRASVQTFKTSRT